MGQRDPAAAFPLLTTRDDTQERQQANRDRGTSLLPAGPGHSQLPIMQAHRASAASARRAAAASPLR